jgi:hypothetical protein
MVEKIKGEFLLYAGERVKICPQTSRVRVGGVY